MIKPSSAAVTSARKRAKSQGKPVSPDTKRAPINMMDVLRTMDALAKAVRELEKEVHGKRDY